MHQGLSACINVNIDFCYWNVGRFLHDGQLGPKQHRKREYSWTARGLGPSWKPVWNRYNLTVRALGLLSLLCLDNY